MPTPVPTDPAGGVMLATHYHDSLPIRQESPFRLFHDSVINLRISFAATLQAAYQCKICKMRRLKKLNLKPKLLESVWTTVFDLGAQQIDENLKDRYGPHDRDACHDIFDNMLLCLFDLPTRQTREGGIRNFADLGLLRPIFLDNPEFMRTLQMVAFRIQIWHEEDTKAKFNEYETDDPYDSETEDSNTAEENHDDSVKYSDIARAAGGGLSVCATSRALRELQALCNKL